MTPTKQWHSLLGGPDLLWHVHGETGCPDPAKCAAHYSTRIGDQPSHGAMCRRCYVVACGGWDREDAP